MNPINRGVVVIKPKQLFLDWINRDPTLTPPISPEELKHDCAAILIRAHVTLGGGT